MRKIISILLFLGSFSAFAQIDNPDSMNIQSVIDACVMLRDAANAKDTQALQQAADMLKACNIANFSTLKCSEAEGSLNGHVVFDEAFADSLANGKDALREADNYNRMATTRGQTPNGSYLTKTCFVAAGKSMKYNFKSKGLQEIAVVAETGGLLTMKIHVTNSAGFDKRFDDTDSVKKGKSQRKASFMLPSDRPNNVELEVINCGGKDCSFVVISN